MEDELESMTCPECLGRLDPVELRGGVAARCLLCGWTSKIVEWGAAEGKRRSPDDDSLLDIYHRRPK